MFFKPQLTATRRSQPRPSSGTTVAVFAAFEAASSAIGVFDAAVILRSMVQGQVMQLFKNIRTLNTFRLVATKNFVSFLVNFCASSSILLAIVMWVSLNDIR